MKTKINIGIAIVLLIIISCSGCLDIFNDLPQLNTIIYEEHPIDVAYQITYGYTIDLSGNGKTILSYLEDYPEVLQGTLSNITIHNRLSAKNITIVHNQMIFWEETFFDETNIFLGISASIRCQGILISNLTGVNALTRQQIKQNHPELLQQYCSAQGNQTVNMIDPTHPFIQSTANNILSNSQTDNAFILAKEIFIWLKSNTNYSIHIDNQQTQSSIDTYLSKSGDCDDLSYLYIALCRSLYLPARFIRGYLIDRNEGSISLIPHVWAEVYVGNSIGDNGWIPVECAGTAAIQAEIHQNFATEDVDHLRLFIDDGTNESLNTSSSQISVEYEQGISVNLTHQAMINSYTILSSKKLCVEEDTYRSYC
jgi:hypothetical protein